MDLKKITRVLDKGDHFLVTHSNDPKNPFTVVKSGLHPDTSKAIAAMCNGGRIKAADGADAGTDAGIEDKGLKERQDAAWKAFQKANQEAQDRNDAAWKGFRNADQEAQDNVWKKPIHLRDYVHYGDAPEESPQNSKENEEAWEKAKEIAKLHQSYDQRADAYKAGQSVLYQEPHDAGTDNRTTLKTLDDDIAALKPAIPDLVAPSPSTGWGSSVGLNDNSQQQSGGWGQAVGLYDNPPQEANSQTTTSSAPTPTPPVPSSPVNQNGGNATPNAAYNQNAPGAMTNPLWLPRVPGDTGNFQNSLNPNGIQTPNAPNGITDAGSVNGLVDPNAVQSSPTVPMGSGTGSSGLAGGFDNSGDAGSVNGLVTDPNKMQGYSQWNATPTTPDLGINANGVPNSIARPPPEPPTGLPDYLLRNENKSTTTVTPGKGIGVPNVKPFNFDDDGLQKNANDWQKAAQETAEHAQTYAQIASDAVKDQTHLLWQAQNDYTKAKDNIDAEIDGPNGLKAQIASAKIDPNDWFNKSNSGHEYTPVEKTFHTIGAAIAMAAGAFGSAITGSPNFAMQLINEAIQRRTDKQKYDLARKKDLYALTQADYERALQGINWQQATNGQKAALALQSAAIQQGGADAGARARMASDEYLAKNTMQKYQLKGEQLNQHWLPIMHAQELKVQAAQIANSMAQTKKINIDNGLTAYRSYLNGWAIDPDRYPLDKAPVVPGMTPPVTSGSSQPGSAPQPQGILSPYEQRQYRQLRLGGINGGPTLSDLTVPVPIQMKNERNGVDNVTAPRLATSLDSKKKLQEELPKFRNFDNKIDNYERAVNDVRNGIVGAGEQVRATANDLLASDVNFVLGTESARPTPVGSGAPNSGSKILGNVGDFPSRLLGNPQEAIKQLKEMSAQAKATLLDQHLLGGHRVIDQVNTYERGDPRIDPRSVYGAF